MITGCDGYYPSCFTDYVTGIVLNQEEKIALASFLTFAISSVVFFIIGYLCHHCIYCQKFEQTLPILVIPVYEEVLPQSNANQDSELKENIAYVPISN